MALNFANNNSLSAITAKPSGLAGGGLNLISTQTASSSATISFTSGIDSTYKEYIFKFYDIHPASSSNAAFAFNMSVDGGSNYNVAKTTTAFIAYHQENGGDQALGYEAGRDLANGTGFQNITFDIHNPNDSGGSGTLHLFDPSNTTFVKHFTATSNAQISTATTCEHFAAGYGNTTSAVNAIQFKLVTGNIDSGVIKLYGVS